MSKDEAINLLRNANLTDKKIHYLTLGDTEIEKHKFQPHKNRIF